MKIYMPSDAAKYLKEVQGITITPMHEFVEVDIDLNINGVLVDLFYSGAVYGAEEYHKITKKTLNKFQLLNNFGQN